MSISATWCGRLRGDVAADLGSGTLDRTTVSRLLGISWQAVGNIVERVVSRQVEDTRFDNLQRIGFDEFSCRKRHHYLTIVVNHARQRVVWAVKGGGAETLEAFFDRLVRAGYERVRLVTADLAASWQMALRARVPHARVVFDRFHVERLASDAVDVVRRKTYSFNSQARSSDDSRAGHARRCQKNYSTSGWNGRRGSAWRRS